MGHIKTVCLPADYDIAIAQVRGELAIDEHSAILLLIGESLHNRGKLDQETFELYEERYTVPLKEKIKQPKEDHHKPKREVMMEKHKAVFPDREAQLNETFGQQVTDWGIHDAAWKRKTVMYAKKYAHLENAKQLIELAESEAILEVQS